MVLCCERCSQLEYITTNAIRAASSIHIAQCTGTQPVIVGFTWESCLMSLCADVSCVEAEGQKEGEEGRTASVRTAHCRAHDAGCAALPGSRRHEGPSIELVCVNQM